MIACPGVSSLYDEVWEQMQKSQDGTIGLLWTGGWDSTFRLLQAVVRGSARIQPYYLNSRDRETSSRELRAMETIRERLLLRYPETRSRLLPTRFFDVDGILPVPEIEQAFASMASRIHLGIQFEWLARFCCRHRMHGIELCIESGGTNLVNRELVARFRPGEPELDDSHAASDVYRLFRYYRFPVIVMTKLDMRREAVEMGVLDLLELTWFCHSPVAGAPCGACVPCGAVIQGGLGARIPFPGHVRHHLGKAGSAIRRLIARDRRLFDLLQRLKPGMRSRSRLPMPEPAGDFSRPDFRELRGPRT